MIHVKRFDYLGQILKISGSKYSSLLQKGSNLGQPGISPILIPAFLDIKVSLMQFS